MLGSAGLKQLPQGVVLDGFGVLEIDGIIADVIVDLPKRFLECRMEEVLDGVV